MTSPPRTTLWPTPYALASSPVAEAGDEGELADLAPYLLIEPFVRGLDVIDVAPVDPNGEARLVVVGGANAKTVSWPPGRAGLADGPVDLSSDLLSDLSCDVLLSLTVQDPAIALLAARVVRPGGFAVLRMRGSDAEQGAWQTGLRERFTTVDVVKQVAFAGYAFQVAGVTDVAVNEDLFPESVTPGHYLALVTNASPRPYHLGESLLVPLARSPERFRAVVPDARALTRDARVEELVRERDALLEKVMALEDQRQRQDLTLQGLRRDMDRYLARLSAQAEAGELQALEQDQIRQRLLEAQQELSALRTMIAAEDSGVRRRVLPAGGSRPGA